MCLHLDLSHLNEYKFRHTFADCVCPLCSCSIKPETTLNFFLHCQIRTFKPQLELQKKYYVKNEIIMPYDVVCEVQV